MTVHMATHLATMSLKCYSLNCTRPFGILSVGSPTPNIIVGGDFNLPHTQWNNCTPAKGCPKREKLMIWSLHDFVGTFGLHQVVSQPTHKDGNLLDCEFVNNEELVFDNVNQVLRSVSHHSIVELSTPIHVKPQLIRDVEEAEKSGFHALNYFHSSVQWDDTADEFKQIDWDSRLSSSSATDALESIYKVCLDICEKHIPKKKPSSKTGSKTSRFRKKLCRRRRRINKLITRVTSPQGKKKLSDEILDIERKLMKSYKDQNTFEENKAVSAIKKNKKYFFKYARKFSKMRTKVGPLESDEGELVADSYGMANILMKQYSNMFSSPLPTNHDVNDSRDSTTSIEDIDFCDEDTVEAIDQIRVNSASGLDGVPAILLKKCKNELARALTLLWKKSFESGLIPLSL